MTMLSFRVDPALATQAQHWADQLGIDKSELFRDALHRQFVRLRSQHEGAIWDEQPLSPGERALREIADWGPAEDWSDWSDASR